MAANLFWFYDALVIGIVLVSLYIGAKRGLMKSVVLVVLSVLSIVISWIGAEIATPIIYDNVIKEPLTNAVTQSSEDTDPAETASQAITEGEYGVEIAQNDIQSIITAGGDFFANLTAEMKNNGASENADDIQTEMENAVAGKMLSGILNDYVSPETVSEILASVEGTTDGISRALDIFVKGDKQETALAVEENILAPVIKGIVKVIIFVLLLLVLRLIVGPISELFKFVNKIPVIGPVNSLLGGALGVVEGAILIYAIGLVVRLAIYFTEGSLMFINEQTIANTHLFRFFYDVDLTRF